MPQHDLVGIVYGLLSAVGFGLADFVAAVASRRASAIGVLVVASPIEAVVLGAVAVTTNGSVQPGAVVWGSLYGIVAAVSAWLFYMAMSAGPISVTAPVIAVLNVAVPLTAGALSGEYLRDVAIAGIAMAVAGVVLVCRDTREDDGVKQPRFTAKVARLAVAAGLLLGLGLVFIRQAPPESGYWPLFFAQSAASIVACAAWKMSHGRRLPSRGPLGLSVVVALLAVCANITVLLAMRTWSLSLAST